MIKKHQEVPKLEILDLDEHIEIRRFFPRLRAGYVKVGEQKWMMPYPYLRYGERIYNFTAKSDDIYVISLPRSGTTLTQELVWLVANDIHFKEAKKRPLWQRYEFLDFRWHSKAEEVNDYVEALKNSSRTSILKTPTELTGVDYIESQKSPRFIKSHMPLSLLPNVLNSSAKIVYVARNPKDWLVSRYEYMKSDAVVGFQGNFEQFCNLSMENKVIYLPYWEHIKEAWAYRHRSNLLFIFYEDLKNNISDSIEKVSQFFNKNYDNRQISELVEHLDFDNFKKNPMVNTQWCKCISKKSFIRKGKVGAWGDEFTPEFEKKVDEWIAINLKNTDLNFSILKSMSR